MSAEQVAGPRQQGTATDRAVYWHGTQGGRVALAERQLHVEKPRLRKRPAAAGEQAEIAVPAYEALRKDGQLADRMPAILMRGVLTAKDRQGSSGTPATLQALTYTSGGRSFTAYGASRTIQTLAKETVHRTAPASDAIETQYTYSWHGTTVGHAAPAHDRLHRRRRRANDRVAWAAPRC